MVLYRLFALGRCCIRAEGRLTRKSTHKRSVVIAAVVLLLFIRPAGAREPIPEDYRDEGYLSPTLILADATTRTILFERGGSLIHSPASLAKLMTLNLSLSDDEEGLLHAEIAYRIPYEGTADAMRWGSSVLGLTQGDSVTLLTLWRAAAIASANDAAWSLALLSSDGEVPLFVERMNLEAAALGMEQTTYTDPDGWSSLSRTTGLDQIRLAIEYITVHKGILDRVHRHVYLPYLPDDDLVHSPKKRNTNLLLGVYEGADGLKTGAIPSEAYHFIATAERKNTRLIALVMGLHTPDFRESLHLRASEAASLLDWGFLQWETWRPVAPELPMLPVRHGKATAVRLKVSEIPEALTLKKGVGDNIDTEVELVDELIGPVKIGEEAGFVRWLSEGTLIAEATIVSDAPVERRWRLSDAVGYSKMIRRWQQRRGQLDSSNGE